jgi:hypothetical protein
LIRVLEFGSTPEPHPAGKPLAPWRQTHGSQTVRR